MKQRCHSGLVAGSILALYFGSGTPVWAVDCNSNGIDDLCDVSCQAPGCATPDCGCSADCNSNSVPDECEPSGCSLNLIPDECEPDCNGNMVPDLCDTVTGSSFDCNNDFIPDECQLPGCGPTAPLDLVFIIDTSPSMDQFIGTLCQTIGTVRNDPRIAHLGSNVNFEVLGIAETPGCQLANVVLGNVVSRYGDKAIGRPDVEMLGTCPNPEQGNPNEEDWGPATAIVAANKVWTPGPRIIVPIADAGAQCGDPNDTSDTNAITHAAPVVFSYRVMVSPVVPNQNATNRGFSETLAAGGLPKGKVLFFDNNDNLADELVDLILLACPTDCNANMTPDFCDIASGFSCDGDVSAHDSHY